MVASASRLLFPLLAALALATSSTEARAQEGGGGEAAAAPAAATAEKPRILTAVKDASGTHAILMMRPDGKMAALLGKPGKLRPLDILSVNRAGPSFAVDTIQEGMVMFNTRDHAVTIPGDVGFIQRRPTRTFSSPADKAVVDRALGRTATARPKAGAAGQGRLAAVRAMKQQSGTAARDRAGRAARSTATARARRDAKSARAGKKARGTGGGGKAGKARGR